MRTCIILNPIAGGVKNIDAIQDRLRGLKAERLCLRQQAGDAEEFAGESSDFDLIVSAGGDGTLNEVVNGTAQGGCKAALGVLPLATGTDFARTLGDTTDMETTIEQVMAGKTRAIDLVRVTSDRVRYFVNVSSGGFSGLVDENLTPEIKKTWGPLAYLRSAAAVLPELRAYKTKITFDETETLELGLHNV